MENLLGDIEGVCIFLDDILVTANTRKMHLERLEMVLQRLQDAGLRLKQDKCELFKDSVEYLGFVIDKHGLHKSKQKIEAILNCECPKNVSELKSFLGMVNYYRCFVPNTSSVLDPLHSLLQKGVKWDWGDKQKEAFQKIKNELISERVLAHYNPDYVTIVTSDAGPAGLGAVISQRQQNGEERVIAYASRSLSKAERNYAQIQKEAVAIVFAIKKFHHYLYGRSVPFILRTDHKPLITIFGSKKGVPELAANRLQRYALFLTAYNFEIEYVKSESNVADFLSRSIKNYAEIDEPDIIDQSLFINFITDSMLQPVSIGDIRKESEQDEVLKKVKNYIQNGWPAKCENDQLKPYHSCRLELSLENDCILRGHKLVIPPKYREQLLNELHNSHFGVVKTKTEARARMWWPNIDSHIEQKIGSCSICNAFRATPPRSPLAPWPYPEKPWQRIHLDMFVLFGKQFLVVVDAHSKWLECSVMNKTDTRTIIEKLSEIFCRFGLAQTIVTDNGSNFVSAEFERFCKVNGIKHMTSAPYHPASNGQAENSVKTIKKALKTMLNQTHDQALIQQTVNKFLFSYRNSVHCTTGFSPAQLMFGRCLRGRLDLLREPQSEAFVGPPTLSSEANQNVLSKQTSQCEQFGGQRKVDFEVGEKVLIKHFFYNGNKSIWKQGVIKEKIGTRMYIVYISELDISVKKHVDHLLEYKGPEVDEENDFTYYDCEPSNEEPDASVPERRQESDAGEEVNCENAERETENAISPTPEDGHSGPDDTPFSDCVSDNDVTEPSVPNKLIASRPVRSTRNPNPMYNS